MLSLVQMLSLAILGVGCGFIWGYLYGVGAIGPQRFPQPQPRPKKAKHLKVIRKGD